MESTCCSKCGELLDFDSRFCASCGTPAKRISAAGFEPKPSFLSKGLSSVDSILNLLLIPLKSGVAFFIIYFICMLPTYYLPYVGSNSALLNAASSVAGLGLSPQFWTHVAFLFVLILVTWLRGCVLSKQWIMVFPVIASLFDMVAGLNIIPLVPTAMHVTALIIGVKGTDKNTSEAKVPMLGAALAAIGAFVVVSGLLYSWAWPSRLSSTKQSAPVQNNDQSQQSKLLNKQPNDSSQRGINRIREVYIGNWYNGRNYRARIVNGKSKSVYRLFIWNAESHIESAFEIDLLDRSGGDRTSENWTEDLSSDDMAIRALNTGGDHKDKMLIMIDKPVRDKNGNVIGPGSDWKYDAIFLREK